MVIGSGAGGNIVSFGSNIYIGSGVHGPGDEVAFIRIGEPSILGFPYDTYLAGIFNRDVEASTAVLVWADAIKR